MCDKEAKAEENVQGCKLYQMCVSAAVELVSFWVSGREVKRNHSESPAGFCICLHYQAVRLRLSQGSLLLPCPLCTQAGAVTV